MQRHQGFPAVMALAFCLVVAPAAQAALGEFQYGTAFGASSQSISPTTTVGGPGSLVTQVGVGNFASPTGPIINAGLASGANIVVGTINVTDLGKGIEYTDKYAKAISLSVNIRDVDSGSTGVITASGTLRGTVSSNGTTQGSVFDPNPFDSSGLSPSSIAIGAAIYTLAILPTSSFAAPGSPPTGGKGLDGKYTFFIKAVPNPNIIPEPASFTLMGLGALGAFRITRKRKLATA
ncbi:MAG: hypothetical protein NVSMB14_04330 [Isosphaeraceae bacterium]